MKDNEMISVIIPVYNVEDYIDECMELTLCRIRYLHISILYEM